MSKSELVSVIIPTYNRPNLLNRALKSVERQTYDNIEVIVVDDSSEEEIDWVIESRLVDKFITHDQNRGASAARNTGMESAEGKYIAFLDSDDEWIPNKLDIQLNYLDDFDIVTSFHYSCIGECCYIQGASPSDGGGRRDMLTGWMPGITSTLIFNQDIVTNEKFDTNLSSFQEYDFILQLSRRSSLKCISQPLALAHHHEKDGISTDPYKRKAGAERFFNKWEKEIKYWAGDESYKEFRNDRISSTYYMYSIKNSDINPIKSICYLITASRLQPNNYKMIEAIMATLLSKNYIKKIKKFYFCLFGKQRKNILIK